MREESVGGGEECGGVCDKSPFPVDGAHMDEDEDKDDDEGNDKDEDDDGEKDRLDEGKAEDKAEGEEEDDKDEEEEEDDDEKKRRSVCAGFGIGTKFVTETPICE